MDDLISRKAAIEAVEDEWENAVSLEYERDIIINDTIDALNEVPSAEKTGRWILVENPNYSPFDGSSENIMICSVCGYKQEQHDFNYCPNCGAKMEG